MKTNVMFWAGTLLLLMLAGFAYGQNSVLSEGDWYKFSVAENGIYQIGYDDLVNAGIDPDQINPKQLRLFGNGNGMLPEANDAFRYDDLQENAIFVYGEDDEVFDAGDFILFYGESPTEWNFNSETSLFEHEVNLYTDQTCYFLTIGPEGGKRVQTITPPAGDPNLFISTSNDFMYHENEDVNLIASGKQWFGELFEGSASQSFSFNIPNLEIAEPIYLSSAFAVRSFENSSMDFLVDGVQVFNSVFTSVNPSSTKFAQYKSDSFFFDIANNEFELSFQYNPSNDSSVSWLDFFELNYTSAIYLENNQLEFRNLSSVGLGNITMFYVDNADASTWVWNVTDPLNITGMDGMVFSDQYEYKIETDSLLEFIAFKGMEFPAPVFVEQVDNQNLHAIEAVDFLVISDETFTTEAEQLGNFHQTEDGLSWAVVNPQQIYNEYSSGSQDLVAIRDFVRDMYLKSGETQPAFLLLMGDGSYDYKDRIENNTNFIPAYQSEESLISSTSICTDDFYTWMDEDEGITGNIDLSVGRLPVKTTDEASEVVDKIIHYATDPATLGAWRNEYCFVADNADWNLHQVQADSLAPMITEGNVTKLFIDFYDIIQTANGPECPEAEQKLQDEVEDGLLYLNYTGHGGGQGWAQERILENEDIENWDNSEKLPLIVAATADFGRFDDPAIQSGGELALLKNDGGAIGVISAGRLSYAQSNFQYNLRLVDYMEDESVLFKRLGDLHREAKPLNMLTTHIWGLLGDPALKLAIPEFSIITDSVNGMSASQLMDTLHPGQQLVVKGFVAGDDGLPMTGFSGNLNLKVFDRPYIKTTLANDSVNSYPEDIWLQDSLLTEQSAFIENGYFEVSFTLPQDMSQEYGNIKLSYYAENGSTDAAGQFKEITVGGQLSSAPDYQSDDFVSLYPSLTSGIVNYSVKEKATHLKLRVFNATGNLIFEKQSSVSQAGEVQQIDLSALPDGLYFVNILSGDKINRFKIVKQ